MLKCPECGKEVEEVVRYCADCKIFLDTGEEIGAGQRVLGCGMSFLFIFLSIVLSGIVGIFLLIGEFFSEHGMFGLGTSINIVLLILFIIAAGLFIFGALMFDSATRKNTKSKRRNHLR